MVQFVSIWSFLHLCFIISNHMPVNLFSSAIMKNIRTLELGAYYRHKGYWKMLKS